MNPMAPQRREKTASQPICSPTPAPLRGRPPCPLGAATSIIVLATDAAGNADTDPTAATVSTHSWDVSEPPPIPDINTHTKPVNDDDAGPTEVDAEEGAVSQSPDTEIHPTDADVGAQAMGQAEEGAVSQPPDTEIHPTDADVGAQAMSHAGTDGGTTNSTSGGGSHGQPDDSGRRTATPTTRGAGPLWFLIADLFLTLTWRRQLQLAKPAGVQ